MNIIIVGTGYVGLVTGTCFAEIGNNVTCVDVDVKKIDQLKKGNIPIYEPGLTDMVLKNVKENRLHFTTQLTDCLDSADIVFSAVGTPPDEDGSADLKYVLTVAKTFGENIKKRTILVTKSTVPVGTAEKVRKTVQEELEKRGVADTVEFDVVSNPEFLKEGSAVTDFLNPDRVVIGVDSEYAHELMARLYKPFALNNPNKVIFTDIPSAEMIKYAANSMLATRISFMNDIANLCELVGANVDNVRKGIGSDTRIGSKFLYAGAGYGGSCFPKDVKALIKTAEKNGYDMKVLKAVEEVNERQKTVPALKIDKYFKGKLKGTTIALWGLAFKPETDDMREATALKLIEIFTGYGATVRVYDPIAMNECKRRIGTSQNVVYCSDMYDAAAGADAVVLVTEWKEFRMPDWNRIKESMEDEPIIVDGRNIYDRKELESYGFAYSGIGK